MVSISDVNTRINALRTGKIDAMDRCDLKTIHLLEKDSKIQIVRVTGKKHNLFSMRTDMAPYDNNDVRLAMKYAIDRENILKVILNGYGTLEQPDIGRRDVLKRLCRRRTLERDLLEK
jgi:peptide/nickel transport system substrate-binding protein